MKTSSNIATYAFNYYQSGTYFCIAVASYRITVGGATRLCVKLLFG